MTVSVIIPTYNGAHKILNVLRAIEQQTIRPEEVIVIIDGSTDQTAALIRAESFNFISLRLVEQANQGRARTRNAGAEAARGELLVFFDDDMRPLPHCLAEHLHHHQQHSEGSVAVGTQLEDFAKTNTDFLRYKGELSRKWMQKYTAARTVKMAVDQPFITAANFSLPQQVFKQLGGFEATLTDAEDFDLAMRASEAGVAIYFLSNAEAWHDDLVNCASYIRRLREHGRENKTLSALRPAMLAKYRQSLSPAPAGLKRQIMALFKHAGWVQLIDSGRLSRLLPKPLRYKLYDVVTTAQGVCFTDA
jgi:glycosyltransferase involved in cell wall biosynthesis